MKKEKALFIEMVVAVFATVAGIIWTITQDVQFACIFAGVFVCATTAAFSIKGEPCDEEQR